MSREINCVFFADDKYRAFPAFNFTDTRHLSEMKIIGKSI